MTHMRRIRLLTGAAKRREHTNSGQLLEDDHFVVFDDCHSRDTFDDGEVDRSEFRGAAQNT